MVVIKHTKTKHLLFVWSLCQSKELVWIVIIGKTNSVRCREWQCKAKLDKLTWKYTVDELIKTTGSRWSRSGDIICSVMFGTCFGVDNCHIYYLSILSTLSHILTSQMKHLKLIVKYVFKRVNSRGLEKLLGETFW